VNGVLVVDKPAGPTSHDVVDKVRRALSLRRVGHTGSLDPFATGVLALCLGKATRLARFLGQGVKVYEARVRFGFSTDTDDLTGEPLGPPGSVDLDRGALEAACRDLTGDILQLPPSYSAKRVGGRRLYDLARSGVAVERQAARVSVFSVCVLRLLGSEVELEIECSPGTYIRALARDLGQALGLGGHLAALRRTRSGAFTLNDAVSLEEVDVGSRILPLSRLLLDLPAVCVGAEGLDALRHGRDLDRDLVLSGFPEAPPPRMRVLDPSGDLLALAVPHAFSGGVSGLPLEPRLHPEIVLAD
jgi:tRNA pseudouridine55 synthase